MVRRSSSWWGRWELLMMTTPRESGDDGWVRWGEACEGYNYGSSILEALSPLTCTDCNPGEPVTSRH